MKQNNPEWLKEAIFYEIYPQSFCDSNGDGIGDFCGIVTKLDYIKELGCNAIWMNPCFESPFGDAGYDVSDYYKTAPRYGTNEDLKHLFDEVHKRGMHILLDLVPGHTSIEHEWFKMSALADKNEFSDRYIWNNSVWDDMGGGHALSGVSERNGRCLLNFFTHQPALNYGYLKPAPRYPWQQSMDDEGPRATVAELKNIMRFWLEMGCDGFRVDMAYSLVKNDPEREGAIKIWQEIRAILDTEFPNAVLVSEWGNPAKALKAGFHMDFLLPFGDAYLNDLFRCEKPFFASKGEGRIDRFVEKYLFHSSAENGVISVTSGNHDEKRLRHFLTPDEMRVAFAFILSMPGVPFIYYGDEIGMNYLADIKSVEGGYDRTGSRTPMQWNGGTNAGFSTAPKEKLYLMIDPDKNRPDVMSQMADGSSLWHEVKNLIAFRRQSPALAFDSKIEFLNVGYPLVYRRKSDKQSYVCIFNPTDKTAFFEVSGKIVYTVGKGAVISDGKCKLNGNTAVFIEE